MTYEITVGCTFSATHQLRLPDGSLEPLHGHDWQVRVCVGSDTLDAMECVCDFHEVEARLRQLVATWQWKRLNDEPPFRDGQNPSAERVAEAIAKQVRVPSPARVMWAQVTEAPGCVARFVIKS